MWSELRSLATWESRSAPPNLRMQPTNAGGASTPAGRLGSMRPEYGKHWLVSGRLRLMRQGSAIVLNVKTPRSPGSNRSDSAAVPRTAALVRSAAPTLLDASSRNTLWLRQLFGLDRSGWSKRTAPTLTNGLEDPRRNELPYAGPTYCACHWVLDARRTLRSASSETPSYRRCFSACTTGRVTPARPKPPAGLGAVGGPGS